MEEVQCEATGCGQRVGRRLRVIQEWPSLSCWLPLCFRRFVSPPATIITVCRHCCLFRLEQRVCPAPAIEAVMLRRSASSGLWLLPGASAAAAWVNPVREFHAAQRHASTTAGDDPAAEVARHAGEAEAAASQRIAHRSPRRSGSSAP